MGQTKTLMVLGLFIVSVHNKKNTFLKSLWRRSRTAAVKSNPTATQNKGIRENVYSTLEKYVLYCKCCIVDLIDIKRDNICAVVLCVVSGG